MRMADSDDKRLDELLSRDEVDFEALLNTDELDIDELLSRGDDADLLDEVEHGD